MIGKMFRPIEIRQINDKRGYLFVHKYKSNLGKINEFTQKIYLVYDLYNSGEHIYIEFEDLNIPVIVDNDFEMVGHSAISKKSKTVSLLRKLTRPNKISRIKKDLRDNGSISIISNIISDIDTEGEILEFDLQLKFVNGQDQLRLCTSSMSTIVVKTKGGIIIDGN